MEAATKKKLIIGAVLVVVVVVVIYYFSTRNPYGTWKEIRGGDISGTQYDIETGPFTSIDDAKKRAIELGAKSFLVNGSNVIYKNVSGPVTTTPNGTYTLYIKQ